MELLPPRHALATVHVVGPVHDGQVAAACAAVDAVQHASLTGGSVLAGHQPVGARVAVEVVPARAADEAVVAQAAREAGRSSRRPA